MNLIRVFFGELRRAWSNYRYWKDDRRKYEAWEREQWERNERVK